MGNGRFMSETVTLVMVVAAAVGCSGSTLASKRTTCANACLGRTHLDRRVIFGKAGALIGSLEVIRWLRALDRFSDELYWVGYCRFI